MNATIRDVAEAAGVSISSVHIALSGKKGVSEATRAHVREIAKNLGYQPNNNAASLKRKKQRILIVLPGIKGNNKFYYPPLWQGIHDYMFSHMLNAEYIELPYNSQDSNEVVRKARELVRSGEVNGILTAGHMKVFTETDWNLVTGKNITVVFVNSDRNNTKYLCCVEPNYKIIGRTMAELITSRIEPYGSIFMLAGNPEFRAHAEVVLGFDEYLDENNIKNIVYKDYSWNIEEANYTHILHEVMRPDIAACASVFSQGTFLLGQALEKSGKTDVFSVGSDLSEDTIKLIKKGIFNNVIQKNPYAQGYLSTHVITNYLVNGKEPELQKLYVGADVIFKSNLPMYEKNNAGSVILA